MVRCLNYAKCGKTVDNVGLKGPYCSLKCNGEVVMAQASVSAGKPKDVPVRVSGDEVKTREVVKPAVRQVEK